MPAVTGVTCTTCGYLWNLPENRMCGRCRQTLVSREAAAPRPEARRDWLERPRNAQELLCFLPLLVGVVSAGALGGGVGGAASILLLRIAHAPWERFTRGLAMAALILATIGVYAVASVMVLAVLHALRLAS